jgi:hypothetical protein
MFVRHQIFNSISRMVQSYGIVSEIIGGVKEYTYRGIQQLPIVLASTSLIYTVATGSVSHMSIFLGMTFIIPFITYILQQIIGFSATNFLPNSVFWKRRGGDTCNIIYGKEDKNDFKVFMSDENTGGPVPSYWIMSISFYIGYIISNAVDSLLTQSEDGSSDVSREKRNYHAITIIITTAIFSFLVLGMRLYFMSSCESNSVAGSIIAGILAIGSSGIGYGMYKFSRSCGARSSDLLGVLSQILPVSSTTPHPIVCKKD